MWEKPKADCVLSHYKTCGVTVTDSLSLSVPDAFLDPDPALRQSQDLYRVDPDVLSSQACL